MTELAGADWNRTAAKESCRRCETTAPAVVRFRSGLLYLTARSAILDDRAEQFPALAVELHHLHLLVDAVVGRRGVGDHAGQRQAAGDVLQIGRLLHDVFAREVVAALLQDLQ